MSQLFRRLQAANVELTVGRVTDRGLRYDLRSVSNLHSVEDLAALPVTASGLRLDDVAEVVYGVPGLTYGRRLNGEPAIAFWIQKSSGANTVEVCRAIDEELERINRNPALAGIHSFAFFNQADEITDSLRGLLQAGAVGSVLAVVILLLFGSSQVPKLARNLGKAQKEFKDGLDEAKRPLYLGLIDKGWTHNEINGNREHRGLVGGGNLSSIGK